jgi:hypothetical protein
VPWRSVSENSTALHPVLVTSSPAAPYVTIAMSIAVVQSAAALAAAKPDAGIGLSVFLGLLGYVLAGLIAAIILIVVD